MHLADALKRTMDGIGDGLARSLDITVLAQATVNVQRATQLGLQRVDLAQGALGAANIVVVIGRIELFAK